MQTETVGCALLPTYLGSYALLFPPYPRIALWHRYDHEATVFSLASDVLQLN
jgi:hypothetical protein